MQLCFYRRKLKCINVGEAIGLSLEFIYNTDMQRVDDGTKLFIKYTEMHWDFKNTHQSLHLNSKRHYHLQNNMQHHTTYIVVQDMFLGKKEFASVNVV